MGGDTRKGERAGRSGCCMLRRGFEKERGKRIRPPARLRKKKRGKASRLPPKKGTREKDHSYVFSTFYRKEGKKMPSSRVAKGGMLWARLVIQRGGGPGAGKRAHRQRVLQPKGKKGGISRP